MGVRVCSEPARMLWDHKHPRNVRYEPADTHLAVQSSHNGNGAIAAWEMGISGRFGAAGASGGGGGTCHRICRAVTCPGGAVGACEEGVALAVAFL